MVSGYNNYITIYFKNWNLIKKQFVLVSNQQFTTMQHELIHYLKRGIITETEVLSLLNIHNYEHIQVFRNIVQKS